MKNSVFVAIGAMVLLCLLIGLAVTLPAAASLAFAAFVATGFVAAAVGSVGMFTYGTITANQIQKQLNPLLIEKAMLSEMTSLDEDVIAIVRQYELKRLEKQTQTTLP